eukprot:1328048-Rhodomonas_salina.1
MQYRFGRLLVSSQKGNHTTPIKKLKLPIRYPGNTPITVVSVMPGYRGTGLRVKIPKVMKMIPGYGYPGYPGTRVLLVKSMCGVLPAGVP